MKDILTRRVFWKGGGLLSYIYRYYKESQINVFFFTLWKATSKPKGRKSNSQMYQKLVSYLPDSPMGLPPQPFGVESLQFIPHDLPSCPLNPIVRRRDQLGSMQGFCGWSWLICCCCCPQSPQNTPNQEPGTTSSTGRHWPAVLPRSCASPTAFSCFSHRRGREAKFPFSQLFSEGTHLFTPSGLDRLLEDLPDSVSPGMWDRSVTAQRSGCHKGYENLSAPLCSQPPKISSCCSILSWV